ncbi:helix-turn-helix domain-containing protein [Rhizomicrobium palustre]
MPVYWLVRQLADRWSLPVIAELCRGTQRFLELKRALEPVSKRMLTLTLRRLMAAGFVERHMQDTNPPQVSYALSPLGHSLGEALKSLNAWTKLHHATFAAALKRDQRASDQDL